MERIKGINACYFGFLVKILAGCPAYLFRVKICKHQEPAFDLSVFLITMTNLEKVTSYFSTSNSVSVSFALAFSFQKHCRLSRLLSPHSNLEAAGTCS
jgi:hypothetical protein